LRGRNHSADRLRSRVRRSCTERVSGAGLARSCARSVGPVRPRRRSQG
jgi:hypothetical protein